MTTNVAERRGALALVLGRRFEEISYNERVGCFTALALDGLQPNALCPITAYWVYARRENGFRRFDGRYKGEALLRRQVYRVFSNEA